MGRPPQLPTGYKLDEPQGGPPKPPKGYALDGTPPPAPPDQFAQDTATVNAWAQGHPVLGPAARFLVHGGQTAANMLTGFPSFTYHALTDAPTPEEIMQAPQERFVSRMIGMPQAIEAGQEYAAGHVTPAGAVSVLPEALGEGVGNVTGGAFYGKGTEVAGKVPGELNRVIPSTTRAGRGLATLETQYAAHPVEATRFLQEAARMEDQLGTIGERLPAPIDFLRNRIQMAQGNPQMGIPPDPFAFQEARTAIKQLNSKINFRNPSPSDILYQRAAGALAQDITESTGRPSPVAPEGFQADYQRMLNESRRGNKAIRFAENFGPYAGAFAGYELGHELGAPLGAEFATGYLGRQIGKPIAGAIMRSVIGREGGPPNISAPPTPPSLAVPPPPSSPLSLPQGSYPMPPPQRLALPPAPPEAPAGAVPPRVGEPGMEAATRRAGGGLSPTDTLRVAQGKVDALRTQLVRERAEGNGNQYNTVSQLQQAEGELQDAQKGALKQAAAPTRDTGIFQQVQKEHPEWTISQVAQEAAKRAKGVAPAKPAPPPPRPIARNLPPEAYTRFLLEAKNGDITNGELERRFAKYGGGPVVPLRRG